VILHRCGCGLADDNRCPRGRTKSEFAFPGENTPEPQLTLPYLLAAWESQRPVPCPVRMAIPEVERLVDTQQPFGSLIMKVGQPRVHYTTRCEQSASRKLGAKFTSDAFWDHALVKNTYLVHIRPETGQDGEGLSPSTWMIQQARFEHTRGGVRFG
jgi:hypothetical protein